MSTVSLLCVTNRPGGIDILKDNLDRQTFRKFEVVLVDDLYDWRHEEVAEYLKDYKLTHLKPRQKLEGDVWNLNKAYNDGINACSSDLIISLQDYIWIPANGIQRFIEVNEIHPKSIVTGCGHKYKFPDKIDTKDKISCFVRAHKLEGDLAEFDDRMRFNFGLNECDPSYYELNWSSFPKKEWLVFNEDMDRFYGCDNIYFGFLAEDNNYKTYVDRINVCKGYSQSLFGRPSDWDEKHFNKKNRFNDFLWKAQNPQQ